RLKAATRSVVGVAAYRIAGCSCSGCGFCPDTPRTASPSVRTASPSFLPVIGRSYLSPESGCQQDPRSNRACGFPAHGLPRGIRRTTLRSHRVADGPAQAVETEGVEEGRCPLGRLSRARPTTMALE